MAVGGGADKRIEARAPGPLAGGIAALAIVAVVVGATLFGLFLPFYNWLTDRRFSLSERARSNGSGRRELRLMPTTAVCCWSDAAKDFWSGSPISTW